MDTRKQTRYGPQSICPYIGLYDDPDSLYSYPNSGNYCYNAEPAQSVSISHQQLVCLTNAHSSCKIYPKTWQGALPPEIRSESEALVGDNSTLLRIFLVLMVGVVLVVAAYFFIERVSFDPSLLLKSSPTPIPSPTHISTATKALPSRTPLPPTFTPTTTATPLPTRTATPSLIPTRTPGPDLGTPFGPQKGYILHQVTTGESLFIIAQRYQTSIEVIQASNTIFEGASVQPNSVLVILPGQTDPINLPRFHVVHIKTPVLLGQLSQEYEVSIDDILSYNNLGPGDTVPGDRWLIIPVTGKWP